LREYLKLDLSRATIDAGRSWWSVFAPPPDLTVSQWADRNRRLSPEASAEPGKWSTSRNEPMRGIMDAVSDALIPTVAVMSSAQVGKTETLLNVIGYHVEQDPAPILLLQPTLEMGEAFSKDRLAPMVRDTPALQGKIKDPRSRDSGNTLLHKTFLGGHITIAGANSPASLASRPIRIVLADEVDRYPLSAGTEGDPVSLARKRSTTFWNRKTVLTSTPTVKGISRIEAEWELSDKRRFHVACADCGHEQTLVWAQVKWPEGKPREAFYACVSCGSVWDDATRWRALRGGKWIATAPFNGTAGFHLNEICSPWVKLGDMAQSFIDAKRSPETLKTWVNTSLGETWEEDAEKVDSHTLAARIEDWSACPDEALVVTVGVDVQGDRLEAERVGWGEGEESWSLDHKVFYGDPSLPDVWSDLDGYLHLNTTRADGTELPVHAACIDSGGHHTQEVYRFTKERARRRVYAIKGVGGPGRPVWPRYASKTKGKSNLFLIGVDAAKDAVYARLKIKAPGPGYCHFPNRERKYFEQMTAEVVQTKYVKGFPTRVYVLPSGVRNEALDCRVYAYAALQSLNVRWGHLLAAQQKRPPKPNATPPAEAEIEQDVPVAPPKVAAVVSARRGRRVRPSSWMS
jgi:phage terminase large subunit GpA-like protein